MLFRFSLISLFVLGCITPPQDSCLQAAALMSESDALFAQVDQWFEEGTFDENCPRLKNKVEEYNEAAIECARQNPDSSLVIIAPPEC
jgi:hypothetical protein